MCERELETEQNCNILTPTLLAITTFLSRSPRLLNRGSGGPASLRHVLIPASSLQLVWFPNWLIGDLRAPSAGCRLSLPHLVSNSSDPQLVWSPKCNCSIGGLRTHSSGFLYRIFPPTDWTFCALNYKIVQCPPSSWGRHKLHSFNPSTVKVILYSSTGCTCYLHRCISYFDNPAESWVNIQHNPIIL